MSAPHRILDGSGPLGLSTFSDSPQLNPSTQELCALLERTTTNWTNLIERVSTGGSHECSTPKSEPPGSTKK
jgi:hypothetical protein